MRQQPLPRHSWSDADAVQVMGAVPDPSRMQRTAPEEAIRRRAVLARAVETEVIPRLLSARRQQGRAPTAEEADTDAAQVERLVGLVLGGTQAEANAHVTAMRDSGVPIESLFLNVLAPTARQLGRMWEDDTANFSDVTLGLMRLGNVMRLLGDAGDYEPARAGPSALLVQMPGEQHGFGLAMVVQFSRRAGWNVRHVPMASSAELAEMVQSHSFGIVGVSVACNDRLDALAADIRAIRRHSRNRAIGVMVGGPPFLAHPQLASMVGADATAEDGRHAVAQAHSLISRTARHR